MTVMGLAAEEAIDEEVLAGIEAALREEFPVTVKRVEGWKAPVGAWDEGRRQHSAPLVLQSVLASIPMGVGKLLAITMADLFIPMLTFVYGQAQLGGRAGVVSLARLRQEFYLLPGNRDLLIERARKEALHETGHLFGLVHCVEGECAMRLSTDIRQLDNKRDRLCGSCRAAAREKRA